MNSIHLLISIDDTDNLESRGSGAVAEDLARQLRVKCLAECGDITRHQLFVHQDIPYTSGNSAMCFAASTKIDKKSEVIKFGQDFLQKNSAAGSDPGLCVAVLDSHLERQALITFGQCAKNTLIYQQAAWELAGAVDVHLSAHGGTGGGVIGALAAIGLRLGGSDGRFRGWHHLGKAGDITTAAQLCAHAFVDGVVTPAGDRLAGDIPIVFAEDRIKTVLFNGAQVIPVARIDGCGADAPWSTLSKKESKRF